MLDTIRAKAHGLTAALAAIGGVVIALAGLLGKGGVPAAHTAAVGVGGGVTLASVVSFLRKAETAVHDVTGEIDQVVSFANKLSTRLNELDNTVADRVAAAVKAYTDPGSYHGGVRLSATPEDDHQASLAKLPAVSEIPLQPAPAAQVDTQPQRAVAQEPLQALAGTVTQVTETLAGQPVVVSG